MKSFWKWCNSDGKKKMFCRDNAGTVYGLGVIGAALYYLQTSSGFWNGVLGILKAIVWPAMVVYKILGL